MKERIELSCHTSLGTGISRPEKLIERAKELNMKALALTDFDCCLGYPEAAKVVRNSAFKIIYGVTLPIWHSSDLDSEMFFGHVTLLAKNKIGVKSIYELLSSVLMGEKSLTLDDIINHKENLIVGSSENLFSEQDYLEVTSYQTPDIVNATIKEGEDFGIPVVAVGDVTYSGPNDALLKDVLINSDNLVDDRPILSTKEMLKKFNYLPKKKAEEIVVTNTNLIAEKIENKIEPILREFCYCECNEHFEELKTAAYKKLKELYGNNPPNEVLKRIETELDFVNQPYNITQFYISYKLCDFAHKKGYPTGIRGACPNSFVAFLLGISEINPLEYNLLYESFFGFSGDKLADIDINFPDVIQKEVHSYLKELYGENEVIQAGTVFKTIPDKRARKMAEEYLYKKQKAWSSGQEEAIINILVNSQIKSFEGIHPAGLMIVPKGYSVYEFTPLKKKNGIISTHFDFHDLWDFSLLKVDALGHIAYTFLKKLSDETGVKIEDIPLDDKTVWQLFDDLDTDYISEFGTEFVKNVLRNCRPKCFNDLVKISSLAHGTDVWCDNAETLITRGVVELKDVMANREDVFDFLISKGVDRALAYRAMEIVRKGAAAKRQDSKDFIYSLSIKYNLPNWWAESVCKIRYMFPRGHSVAYVQLAVRLAYFKAHYRDTFIELHKKLYEEEESM